MRHSTGTYQRTVYRCFVSISFRCKKAHREHGRERLGLLDRQRREAQQTVVLDDVAEAGGERGKAAGERRGVGLQLAPFSQKGGFDLTRGLDHTKGFDRERCLPAAARATQGFDHKHANRDVITSTQTGM